jgi:hypothetical protein
VPLRIRYLETTAGVVGQLGADDQDRAREKHGRVNLDNLQVALDRVIDAPHRARLRLARVNVARHRHNNPCAIDIAANKTLYSDSATKQWYAMTQMKNAIVSPYLAFLDTMTLT